MSGLKSLAGFLNAKQNKIICKIFVDKTCFSRQKRVIGNECGHFYLFQQLTRNHPESAMFSLPDTANQ